MAEAVSGKVVVKKTISNVLAGNPLGDPVERDLNIYLPPGYDESGETRYPVLLAVVGFTGTGAMLFNRSTFFPALDQRLDRLIGEGSCGPVIVVAPDCFTRLGGNQYVNSTATGPYEDYLLKEVIPWVGANFPCGRWGVFGKSSGGYGAAVLGMRNPDVFSALADHSGDSNFELCYLPDFGAALDSWREAGGPAAWLDAMWNDDNPTRKKYQKALNMLAMSAHYSPNPESPHLGIDFPFDLETGAFRPDVWERWRAWDPVNMVEHYAENLKRMRLVYVDCGTADEYALHWGARAFVDAMRRHGIEVRHEEFDDGHGNITYRYDTSLPLLVAALLEEE